MNRMISEEYLVKELEHLRDVLLNYDFSEVENIIFFDANSLNCFIKSCKNNPFERQYLEIEGILDKILPYLPSSISMDSIEILNVLFDQKNMNNEILREHILMNMKMDFIDYLKGIETEREWLELIDRCKKIRLDKMNALV